MKDLRTYEITVNITVRAEDETDALDYLYSAIDSSDFITHDGIAGIEVDEDLVFEVSDNDDIDDPTIYDSEEE